MADRIITIGSHRTPSTIRGQGCLASITRATEQWIFETVTSGTGSDTYYPAKLTLDELMELFWRVKTIELNWSYDWADDFGASGTHSGTVTMFREITIGREADLVMGGAWTSGDEFSTPVQILSSDPLTRGVKHVAGGDYYPFLLIYIISGEMWTDLQSETTGMSAPTSFTGHINMSGAAIPFDMWVGDPVGITITNPSLEIDALTYWPHAKADGTAKYNTTTGAKL